MIVIRDNPASEYYYNYCKASWEAAGVEVNRFDASTPETIKHEDDLSFADYNNSYKYTILGLHEQKITDTEKAVWYSHYNLWWECASLNEPILILEHDSLLLSPEKFTYSARHDFISYDKGAMGCYIITPDFSKVIINDFLHKRITIDSGILGHLHALYAKKYDMVTDISPYYRPISNQVMSRNYGNTIEHPVHSQEYYDAFKKRWPDKEPPEHGFIYID